MSQASLPRSADRAIDRVRLIGQHAISDHYHFWMDGKADRVAGAYRRRLARLVESLIAARFESQADLWKIQLDLLSLQRDIQGTIAESKQLPRSSERRLRELNTFRHLLRQSRRFGDALAWVLLGLDEKFIHPLSENQRNSVPAPGTGTAGLVAAAEFLSGEGYGFPLLHDITDILRIGDITFIRPETSPLTVEIKTRLVQEKVTEDGEEIVEYQIGVHHVDEHTPASALIEGSHHESKKYTAAKRMERQLHRMVRARVRSSVADRVPYDLDGTLTISTSTGTRPTGLASLVNKAVWAARRHGIGSASADGSFTFIAIYDVDGLAQESSAVHLQRLDISEALLPLVAGDDPRNCLVIDQIPPDELKGVELHLPYFLLPLPRRAILDMLNDRLVVVVVWNPARVAQALEAEGFEVDFSPRTHGVPPTMIVKWSVSARGQEFRGEMNQLDNHLRKMVMELLPAKYMVGVLRAMREATLDAIEKDRMLGAWAAGEG